MAETREKKRLPPQSDPKKTQSRPDHAGFDSLTDPTSRLQSVDFPASLFLSFTRNFISFSFSSLLLLYLLLFLLLFLHFRLDPFLLLLLFLFFLLLLLYPPPPPSPTPIMKPFFDQSWFCFSLFFIFRLLNKSNIVSIK